MSNLVEQISDGLKTRIAAVLPTAKELEYTFDVEKNNFRGNSNRYGVHPRSAVSVEGVIKSFTLDQDFEVILTEDFKNIAKNDTKQKEKLELLYDRMDDIATDVYNTKIGIPSIVFNVIMDSISEPEFIDEQNNIIVLRGIFIVKYRKQL